MSKQLREVDPGVRVYIPLWNDGVLYEVQAMPRNQPNPDIYVVSEKDGKTHLLPCQTQVVICEEDYVMHEYDANCNCTDCIERRYAWKGEAEA